MSLGVSEPPQHLLCPLPSKGKDPEYGVARGIDFQNVAAVINFDVPPTVESYIHRVGRYVGTQRRDTGVPEGASVPLGWVSHRRVPSVPAGRLAPTTPAQRSPSRCPRSRTTWRGSRTRSQEVRGTLCHWGGDAEGAKGHRGECGDRSEGGSDPTCPRVSPENAESVLQPYKFSTEEIEGLRYRCRVRGRRATLRG